MEVLLDSAPLELLGVQNFALWSDFDELCHATVLRSRQYLSEASIDNVASSRRSVLNAQLATETFRDLCKLAIELHHGPVKLLVAVFHLEKESVDGDLMVRR